METTALFCRIRRRHGATAAGAAGATGMAGVRSEPGPSKNLKTSTARARMEWPAGRPERPTAVTQKSICKCQSYPSLVTES